MSGHKEFYEDYTAVCATESMMRLGYCINRSLTRSRLLEEVAQGICNVLVRCVLFAHVERIHDTLSINRARRIIYLLLIVY